MAKFIVSIRLPDAFEEEFMALIPRHRVFINRLIEDDIIEAYAISADRCWGGLPCVSNTAARLSQ